ncbi:sugar ABC transporter ATPase [Microbacterium sp. CFBP9034]|uniref:sugar ABC transporter ATPase n=1 Tax=Microbacterium sp. CFBP9034 TaxID=3096540 RepID=UPI002A69A811|nr:sugar ABC transporter ATPase [Microbacterium sp. CFBP9034]MDY0908577.1 sugar ABC transporter ATPase [Microbacterium sp. CFBP9034]
MTSSNLPDGIPPAPDGQVGVQPIRDRDSSIEPDPALDPAQAEWDRTIALDEGMSEDDFGATATGDDPAHLSDPRDEVPDSDLPASWQQPETQGIDPIEAELGEEGQGDLAPEDL